jgi:hypothetical protein
MHPTNPAGWECSVSTARELVESSPHKAASPDKQRGKTMGIQLSQFRKKEKHKCRVKTDLL